MLTLSNTTETSVLQGQEVDRREARKGEKVERMVW